MESAILLQSPEKMVLGLYEALLECWNRRDARGMADLFAIEGNLIGFDGSAVNGRTQIVDHLEPIFRDHPTPRFVAKLREIRPLAPKVVLLRAVAGMVTPGSDDINPALNAIQSLVAVRRDHSWQVQLFQNTPAAFHGRLAEAEALAEELREVARRHGENSSPASAVA
ncbi:hypothetical protein FRZ61_20370 [Hypericibacter adhaerens]|uniref:DUF4440 domain-containing protein n=1 Tax=Hypericibacter adhaerens TaxID=2602016 RepID=A0A5J6MWS9_9PROT|nr:SgcJ/EcaC family oxidoreductase [Hypericibacter adhaerens]QEX22108.1 hypothetical protein FRZ61_20370 [Hypericibacter adhaerens]